MKLGILSDGHGNGEAFELALDLLRRGGADRIFYLGDAVGYLPGAAVVDALMAVSGVVALAGNHEVMLLAGETPVEREPIYRLLETRAAMDAAQIEFIKTWPTRRQIDIDGNHLLFVHGSPTDETNGYVYPDSDLSEFRLPGGTTVFMGHTHRPFVRSANGVQFVNVGSCGLPRDCGTLGSACLFNTATREASIIRFDIAEVTARALRRCGPVHASIHALLTRRSDRPVIGVLFGG